MNRINIIALGVRDMARSVKCYRDGLGFKTNEKSDCPQAIFFDCKGAKLGLIMDLFNNPVGCRLTFS
jgi:catechol 2,3-dioxygenase-like lactoylglutathione lyase family enzyme